MSVLDRKLRRDLRASRWLLLAITLIIAIGVNEFVRLNSAYNNLAEAQRRYYRQCRMADFWIDLKKVPLAEVGRLTSIPGIAAVRPRIHFFATVDLENVPEPVNGLVISMPERPQAVINDLVLRRGGYFTERRENEVIVNEAFALRHHLAPGQWIRLVLNNRLEELFIVGTAISSEFAYLLGPGAIIPDAEHFGVFYIKQRYAEDVYNFNGAANEVVGRFAPGMRSGAQYLLDQAERVLGAYGVYTTIPLEDQPSNAYLSHEIRMLRAFGFLLPAIFLTVAAMVLNVLLTRLAEQQRVVVGTLKALGYSHAQVFGHFLKFGLVVGLVGGLAGCALGYWMAALMNVIYRQFFEFPELENHFYTGIHAFALAISLGSAVLGSLHGTWNVLRLQPAEAMRPRTARRGGAVLLERVGWAWRRLSSGWRMVLRDVVRNRLRSLAGTFAAAMGSSLLVTGFMLAVATDYLVDFQFKRLLRADFELAFKDERGREAIDEIARLPGVDRAEPLLNVACTFTTGPYREKGAITGLVRGATLTVPRDTHARAIRVPEAGLAMSRKLAELLHLRRGDRVTVTPVKGLRRPFEIVVAEISDSYVGTAVYTDLHALGRLIGEEMAVTGAQIVTDRDRRDLARLLAELKQMPGLESVTAQRDMVLSLESTFIKIIWIFISITVGFAGIVFFGSILNSSLVSLAERQREVATLRVLGYGPWQVGSLLFRESLIVTLVGTVLGIPVGYLIVWMVSATYDTKMFRYPVISTPGVWIWTLVLAVLFALAAHLFVQRSIHRMNWLEALQAKE